jgi:glycosyltransferase involved in cell wall biosynthesis
MGETPMLPFSTVDSQDLWGASPGSCPITVSIVVPMKNEERYIDKCLETILANDFPMDQCEILVIDGRSTDRSRMIVEEKAAQYPMIRLLDNPEGIPPTALNLGIRAAKGQYIIRMDGHSEYPLNYIRTCLEELERTGADNVGGVLITKPGSDSLVARAIALMTQHPVGVGNAAYRIGLGDRFVDTVPFGAFRKSLFEKIGYYREDLARNQDYELNARIRNAGGKIYLSSKIRIPYYNVPNLAGFTRQAYGNGRWMAHAWLRAPGSFSWRHGAPLAFVSCLLGCLLLSSFSELFRILLLGMVGMYLLFVLAASVQISLRHGWVFLAVLPALFVSYHLCYGVATLIGFLRYPFARRVTEGEVSLARNGSFTPPTEPPSV